MNLVIVEGMRKALMLCMSAGGTCDREHTQGYGSTCALLSCMWVQQVVAVPSLLTQVSDYIAKQNIDKLDIMLVEIGPNDVRPSTPAHPLPVTCTSHMLIRTFTKNLDGKLGRID